MIFADGNLFLLQTANVSYLFRKKASGHLEHVHFGGSLISKYNYKKVIAAGKLEDAFKNGKSGLEAVSEAIGAKH